MPYQVHQDPDTSFTDAPHAVYARVIIRLIFALSLAAFLMPAFSRAAEELVSDHVRISWLAPQSFAADPAAQNATLGIYFEPEPGWHVYWRNPGDSGSAPRFTFSSVNATTGDILWPYPARLPIAHLVNLGYEAEVAYLFKLGVDPLDMRQASSNPRRVQLEVELEWLVCKEECIPGWGTLSLNRSIRGDNHRWEPETKALVDRFYERIPRPDTQSPWRAVCAYWADSGILTLKLEPSDDKAPLDSLPLPDAFPLDGAFFNPAMPELIRTENAVELKFATTPGAKLPAEVDFVLVVDGHAWAMNNLPLHRGAFSDAQPLALGLLLLSAFVGGLILNLMPCVFPVLSIKLFALINTPGEGRAQVRHRLREGISYSAGVLATFALLGILFLALRAGGAAIGWGFQLQSPQVVLGLVLLFWLMGLSFLGSFEFGHSLMQAAGKANTRSSFVTGVLAVFVAAPCTGPFMGTALGAAASMPAISAMVIFLGLGLGLAAPFMLLAASPRLAALLPKPGVWMERLRQFLAFPLFATVLWLLWVLGRLTGESGWVLGGGMLLVIAFALWLGKAGKPFWRRAAWLIALASLVWIFVQIGQAQHAESGPTSGDQWQAYDGESIRKARAEGQGVFIDFTAAWCITCQVNKKLVLDSRAANDWFETNQVLRVRADWTRYDPEITQALAAFGRNSVPLYVYYPADGSQPVILPQLLSVEMIRSLAAR